MRFLLRPAISLCGTTSMRGVGDLFIGTNVQLRKELKNQQLSGIKVAVLHKDNKAVLISKILQDHGAEVINYSVKGENSPKMLNIRELDLKNNNGKTLLQNILRKSDIFVDGIGDNLSSFGLHATDMTKRNGQLIVASVEDNDPFEAINTMKAIALGLYLREKNTGTGQVIAKANSKQYKEDLSSFMKQNT